MNDTIELTREEASYIYDLLRDDANRDYRERNARGINNSELPRSEERDALKRRLRIRIKAHAYDR